MTTYVGKGDRNFIWQSSPTFIENWNKHSHLTRLSAQVLHLVTPLKYFNFIINKKMCDQIIQSSNQKLNKYNLKPLDEIELKAFMGLLLLFGYLKKHDVDFNKIGSVSDPHHLYLAICAMPRDRFKDLAFLISFDARETQIARCQKSKLFKINEIFEEF